MSSRFFSWAFHEKGLKMIQLSLRDYTLQYTFVRMSTLEKRLHQLCVQILQPTYIYIFLTSNLFTFGHTNSDCPHLALKWQ